MIYLASPYSATEEQIDEECDSRGMRKTNDAVRLLIKSMIHQRRYEAVCRAAGRMMSDGAIVFSPIAHTHGIAVHGSLPGDWKFWEKYDREFINVCEKVVVLCLEGWEQSKGVQAEIAIACELGKPVEYVDA